MAITLVQLRERAKVPANMQDSDFLSDSEWTDFANDANRAAWDDVIAVNAQFRVTPHDFSITSTASPTFSLSSLSPSFRSVVNVLWLPDTDHEIVLNRYGARRAKSIWDRSYRLEGTNLVIEPRPRAIGSYRLNYNPQATSLANDSDQLDAELDPFARYYVLHMAMSALATEESPVSEIMTLWQLEQGKLQRWAASSRSADADTVEDTRGRRGHFSGDPWF